MTGNELEQHIAHAKSLPAEEAVSYMKNLADWTEQRSSVNPEWKHFRFRVRGFHVNMSVYGPDRVAIYRI